MHNKNHSTPHWYPNDCHFRICILLLNTKTTFNPHQHPHDCNFCFCLTLILSPYINPKIIIYLILIQRNNSGTENKSGTQIYGAEQRRTAEHQRNKVCKDTDKDPVTVRDVSGKRLQSVHSGPTRFESQVIQHYNCLDICATPANDTEMGSLRWRAAFSSITLGSLDYKTPAGWLDRLSFPQWLEPQQTKVMCLVFSV